MFAAPVQKENARLRLYNAELNDLILATTDGNQNRHLMLQGFERDPFQYGAMPLPQDITGPLLLTWIDFNPSIEK